MTGSQTGSSAGADQEIDSDKRKLVDSVFETAVDSVAWRIARKIHRCVEENKTFSQSMPLETLKNRQDLFPSLYESESTCASALEEYAVELPKPKRWKETLESSSSQSPLWDIADGAANNTNSSSSELNGDGTKSFTMVTRQQAQTDIWGRFPPKEPKENVECSICQRQINTLRFAPHLDKCMGIGTTTRAAASGSGGGSGTRSSQS